MQSKLGTCQDPGWLCWVEAHPALAGWFQAVFSVVAIAVAIILPIWQANLAHRREDRRVHIACKRAAITARSVGKAYLKVISNPSEIEGRNRLEAFPEEIIDASIAELDALPINHIDDPELGKNLSHLLMSMRRIRGVFQTVASIDRDDLILPAWGELATTQVATLNREAKMVLELSVFAKSRPRSFKSVATRWSRYFSRKPAG